MRPCSVQLHDILGTLKVIARPKSQSRVRLTKTEEGGEPQKNYEPDEHVGLKNEDCLCPSHSILSIKSTKLSESPFSDLLRLSFHFLFLQVHIFLLGDVLLNQPQLILIAGFWLSCLGPVVFLLRQTIKLFRFPIF